MPTNRKRSRSVDEPVKWNVSVDSYCTERVGIAQVLCNDDSVWDANLNLSNYSRSNNKFCKLQLLKMNDRRSYSVWYRCGRIGTVGKGTLTKFGPYINKAKQYFKDKFFERTRNDWEDRRQFKRVKGCHDLMDVNLTKEEPNDDTVDTNSISPSKEFDVQVVKLMDLIHDLSSQWNESFLPMYGSTICVWTESSGLLPSEKQIEAAFDILKRVYKRLQSGESTTVINAELTELSNEFYTKIPQNSGRSKPPSIVSNIMVCKKLMELELLRRKLVTPKIPLSEIILTLSDVANNFYNLLDCNVVPLQSESDVFKIIDRYLINSHGETHKYSMKTVHVFECTKISEAEKFKDLGNRKLLWHGSPKFNFSGILGDGLRIPPINPHRILMFGRGVYFADRSSKSANYCGFNTTNRHGLLMLCEVSLGNCEVLLHQNSLAEKPSAGFDSVMGEGYMIPDQSEETTLGDGIVVPLGKCKFNSFQPQYQLFYNEYVVYDPDQIKMRYLVKVEYMKNK